MTIKREAFYSQRIPFRIGAVLDWPWSRAALVDVRDTLRFVLDEATAGKRLDRSVELLVREVAGPPYGSALAVAQAWRELALDEEVQLVLGPHTDEAALAVAQAQQSHPHPTVSACTSSHFSSDFGVTLGAGNAADEAVLLADLHHARGYRVGVIAEATPYGNEALAAFRLHARELGVTLAGEALLAAPADVAQVRQALDALRAAGATAVQIFAGGSSLPPLAAAAHAAAVTGFKPQYVIGSGFAARHCIEGFDAAALEGWLGLDLYDEDNPTAKEFLDRFEQAKGRRPAHTYALLAHDLAQVAIHTLAMAKPHSPNTIRLTLERLRFLPAAVGSADTLICIAPYDHRAYKGAYLVLRSIQGGRDARVEFATRLAA